jgi:N-acetylmuramoyl-L-alanine amidase
MKFGIDKGHNIDYNTGAKGIRQEDELTLEVGNKVIAKLRALGHIVIDTTPEYASSRGDALHRRILTANQNKIDYFVSIHFNTGGGEGAEVFTSSDEAKIIALRVLSHIAALGFKNRGVKDGNWLYVIKNTKAPAMLIECAFVDSKEDMERYNGEAIASAIVRGLIG